MVSTLIQYYNDLMHSGDPRTTNLFLMDSAFRIFAICAAYIFSVTVLGPYLMKNRKPFELKNLILVYNLLQVFISLYIFLECFGVARERNFDLFKCHSVDYTQNELSNRDIRANYLYFLSKFFEFLDTVFFVLRKKFSQVTFLHVYHHASMPIYSWVVTKYYPGGSNTVMAFMNTFIHVIMYFYYFLAGLGPLWRKYLWWKRYLTSLQLLQFVIGTTHYMVVAFSGPECNIPKTFGVSYVVLGIIFFALFFQFYKKQYTKPKIN